MKKVLALFPGQGSQYAGMGKQLHDNHAEVRELFEAASQALGTDMRRLCFEGDWETLSQTRNTQPAILLVSVCAYRVYMKEIGIVPHFAAGHSFGEISALCCSGALDFIDAVKIVRERGRLMQEAVPPGVGGMAAVTGIDAAAIETVCAGVSNEQRTVAAANYNAPDQTVISGDLKAVAEASERLRQQGAAVIPLKVSAPFHSPLMQPCADRFQQELDAYTFHEPAFPVISNVTGLPCSGKGQIADLLVRQIASPVLWADSMAYLQRQQVDIAVELGPRSVLKGLMARNAPVIKAFAFDVGADAEAVSNLLSANAHETSRYDGTDIVVRCIAAAVTTKNANWDQREYSSGVAEPYRKLVSVMDAARESGVKIDRRGALDAIALLKMILDTKKLPDEEKNRILTSIREKV